MTEVRVYPPGDIDLDSAPELLTALRIALAIHDADLLVDCSNMTFIDAAGIRVLLIARDETKARGRDFRVENLAAFSQHIFKLVHVDETLHVIETSEPENTTSRSGVQEVDRRRTPQV